MKYESSLIILEAISEGVVVALDLFEAVATSGYGASRRGIGNKLYEIGLKRRKKNLAKEEDQKRRKRFQSLIYKLKRDGLIKEEGDGEEKRYELTIRGEQKLELLKGREGFPDVWYPIEKGDKVIIVMFDIPEEQTKKRRWLRLVLQNLDFKLAQKSVWIGKTKIPKELIADLIRMQLEDFVEIFEVGKTGNLKHLI